MEKGKERGSLCRVGLWGKLGGLEAGRVGGLLFWDYTVYRSVWSVLCCLLFFTFSVIKRIDKEIVIALFQVDNDLWHS